MSSGKIPSYVVRELRRHINAPRNHPSPPLSPNSPDGKESQRRSRMFITLAGAVTLVGFTSSIPYFVTKWIGSLNERDAPLTSSQIRRGAFNNSGSKDAGKDPMWDFRTGTRIKDEAYIELFKKDDPNHVDHGDLFVAASKRR